MLPSSWSVTSRSWAVAALRDACEVVGIVGRQRHLDQLSDRSLDDAELLATVAGGERRRAPIRSARTRGRTARASSTRGTPSVIDPSPCNAMAPSSGTRHCRRSTESTACHGRIGMSTRFRYCTVVAKRSRIAAMATAAPTRTEQVYARMRSDILAGHLHARRQAPVRRARRPLRRQHQCHPGRAHPTRRAGTRAGRAATRLPRRSVVDQRPRRPDDGAVRARRVSCCGCRSRPVTSSGSRRSSPPTTRSSARRWLRTARMPG